jgi:peptidoglycan/LPS O-acetylase OafA/YrhL
VTIRQPHIPELDGIRAIAILMVIVWHHFVLMWSPSRVPRSPTWRRLGV